MIVIQLIFHPMDNIYYEFTVPVFVRSLTNLKGILVKAQSFSQEKGIPELELLEKRLALDMFPLVKQVQIATDNAKGAVARLIGIEAPKMDDDETTFAELIARIDTTIAFLKGMTPAQFSGAERRTVSLHWMPEGTYFEASTYFRDYVHQNFFFHYTTAYDILRNQGLDIGKRDYMGSLEMKQR